MRSIAVSLFWLVGSVVTAVVGVPPQGLQVQKLKTYTRQFQNELGISDRVSVYVVPENERLASVRPSPLQKHAYILEVDRKFLATLTDEEQRAMIAHEMGHVWIFTHYPYIQSEPLANQKAEGLVSESSLVKVYEKVWQVDGRPGTLDNYLDQKVGIARAPESDSSGIPALSSASDASQPRK